MTATEYAGLPHQHVVAANGVDYRFRDTGSDMDSDRAPLVLLQHFRGNLDNWDPALVDALASARRVVTFDNTGVGGTRGPPRTPFKPMAQDAIAFLKAQGFDEVDLLGFSIGSFVAQEIALIRPDIVRKLVLAASAPRGADGMHGWAPDVIAAVGGADPIPRGTWACSSPPRISAGKRAGKRWLRMLRPEPRIATPRRRGPTREAHTTPSAAGASRPRGSCNASVPSALRSSWRTGTAIR